MNYRYLLCTVILPLFLSFIGITPVKATTVHTYSSTSVLSKGKFFKVRIVDSGVYQLTYEDLNAKGIDPANVKVFGYGGAALEEDFRKTKPDDLPEIAVYDTGNSILFYAQGINKWAYNSKLGMFTHKINPYSQYGYYFVTSSDVGVKKRITAINTPSSSSAVDVTEFTDYQVHEKEEKNVISSGKEFYGEEFSSSSTSLNVSFNFPNMVTSSAIAVRIDAISTAKTNYYLTLGSQKETFPIDEAKDNNYHTALAGNKNFTFTPNADNFTFKLEYSVSGAATGRLNYIEVTARRKLMMSGASMAFHNTDNIAPGAYNRYLLSNGNSKTEIWDITNPLDVKRINTTTENNLIVFTDVADTLKSYLAIDPTGSITKAVIEDEVPYQNIHALPAADMLIITNPLFIEQAQKLAQAHYDNDGLRVNVVTTEQVYNEFSSGTPDATAYRWAAKMFYDRPENKEDKLKYLLLFGKGTFDNRDITPNSGHNYVLTYQSDNSTHETKSFVTDDYFGLLDDGEGRNITGSDKIDIGIGRFPTKSVQEAENVVNKTIAYMENKEKGIWKNQLCFIGDDGDKAIHMESINKVADNIAEKYPAYQVIKILMDAYQQEINASGETYPAVNNRIQNLVRSGIFLLTYMGHAGSTGWANEQILTSKDIRSYKNKNLPIMVAGTCNFSLFDKIDTSGGEEFVLNPSGGSIGSFSAARTVYESENRKMVDAFCKNLLKKIDGQYSRIGDVVKQAKLDAPNNYYYPVNNLSYLYFGDPALKINYPEPYEVTTTHINGRDILIEQDTLTALSVATVKGAITDNEGNTIVDFNGYAQVTVYDKEEEIETQGNDNGSKKIKFKDRPNTLFTGKVKVSEGKYEFSFMLPKDIKYNYGYGRMNYYAWDDENNYEAQGYCEDFVIGGIAEIDENDKEGPEAEIYLNYKGFTSGSRVNETPLFIAEVYDINGINTSGAGTGHDITLYIDDNTTNYWFNLNDYFETEENNYQKGKVSFMMPEIEEGNHTLTFKVWDLLNNSTTKTLDFVVVKGLKPVIFSISNYPNPASDQTTIQIDHDRQDEVIEITIDIYDLSGRKVWSFTEDSSNRITWNLCKSSGEKINPGIYVYRVSVSSNGKISSAKSDKIIVIGQ